MSSSLEEALERYPRIALTRLPTLLQALPSLGTRFELQVFIKRDDLTDLVLGEINHASWNMKWRRHKHKG